MTAPIAALLSQLKPAGTFATRLRAPAADLELEVTGVGKLKLPVTARAAQQLRAVASPSPFGLREQTLYDPSVRNTWEVAPRRLKLSRRWAPALAKHLAVIKQELGLPEGSVLRAELDKLLLYEPGQFFKAHQDSEKCDDMVGTLVVVLPSQYKGGALTVEHQGARTTFQRLATQSKDLSLLAFYADCHHEVSRVSSGVRVALTYRLLLEPGAGEPSLQGHAELVARLASRVREHFTVPIADRYSRQEPAPPRRLVYLLDHEYTQRSLSWGRLKSGDQLRTAALREVARQLDCECSLALAEVQEVWNCEDEGYGSRSGWGRRRWRDDDDDNGDDDGGGSGRRDPDEYTLIDLCDGSISLHHWVDAGGKRVAGVPSPVEDAEFCLTRSSDELKPFRTEHEGYQGNYGNTLERWYHRAAVVIWPRALSFALLAESAPSRAIDQLLAFVRAKQQSEAVTKVRSLLPRWPGLARSTEGVGFAAKVAKLAVGLADAELALRLLSPLDARCLSSQPVRRQLVALVQAHGLAWGQELFTAWTQRGPWRAPEWIPRSPPCLSQQRVGTHHRAQPRDGEQPGLHALELDMHLLHEPCSPLLTRVDALRAFAASMQRDHATNAPFGERPHQIHTALLRILRRGAARCPRRRSQSHGRRQFTLCATRRRELPLLASRATFCAVGEDHAGGGKNMGSGKASGDQQQGSSTTQESARAEIEGNSDVVYKLDKLFPHFYAQQGIQPGSIHDQIIQDKLKDDAVMKVVKGIAVAIVAVALAVVTFGTATPAIIAAGAGIAGAGLSVYMALEEYKEYTQQKDLADVGFADDPSMVWLVIAVVGAGLDMGAAVKAMKALGPAAKVLNAGGDISEFGKAVKALEQASEIEAKVARAAEKAAAAKQGYADASKELIKALGKAYSFPGPLADPEVYAAVVKMARFAIKGKLHDFEKFLAELKAARNAAKMADLSPEELAKVKQAWEEAKVLEAAEKATYEKLNKVIPDTAKLDALVAKAGDQARLERLLHLFTESELDSIFVHVKDPKKLLSVFDHMNHATAKNMLLEMVSKGKIDKLNNFVERVAAGGAQLGETAAVGSKSLIIDSQAAIALIKDANGVALQPGEKAWVAYLKSLPGDVELRVGNMTVGEIQGGVITVKGMPLDVAATASRQATAYQDTLKVLERAGIGGKGGLADRAVIADALFAKVEAGVTPTIALADQNAVKNLARLAGVDVVKAGGYKGLVTSYGSTGFKVTIEGRELLIRPLPAVK